MIYSADNSHSQMISAAGWRENQPNRVPVVFEAELDLSNCKEADLQNPAKWIRNFGECPERLVTAIVRHYRRVWLALNGGSELMQYFSDVEKWMDIWSRIKSLPRNVTFPKEISGSLNMSALTTLPENVTFPEKCGYLYLRALTTLPENVTFPEKCGSLDLSADLKRQMSSNQKSKTSCK